MTSPFAEAITATARTASGVDAYGNDTFTESTLVRYGAFDPAIGYETMTGREMVSSQPQALFTGQEAVDMASFLTSSSTLTIRGAIYDVDGSPSDWRSPFTGRRGLQVPLHRVAG